MKSKAPLTLMEQTVMVLVFALAAAVCMQAFVKADHISVRSEEKSYAALAAQDVAELLKHSGGDMGHALTQAAELSGGTYEQGLLYLDYDADWNPAKQDGVYRLTVMGVPVEESGLQKALVRVVTGATENPELLFELEVAWLEVSPDE